MCVRTYARIRFISSPRPLSALALSRGEFFGRQIEVFLVLDAAGWDLADKFVG